MAKKVFKCSKCTRTFSMPAHLARHMNTIHGRKGKKKVAKKVAKRPAKRKVGRPKKRRVAKAAPKAARPAASGVARIVSQMKAYVASLNAQRAALDAEIGVVTKAMAAMGGKKKRAGRPAAAPKKRGRPAGGGARAGSLKDFIVRVLKQRSTPMSPREIAVSVRKAGYKTKAKDLTKAVSNTLPDLKAVKRQGFGRYTA